MDPFREAHSAIGRLGRWRSSGDDVQGLTRWLRRARALRELSGGLLFDGETWLMLMQGPADVVLCLLEQLVQYDPGAGSFELHAVTPAADVPGWRVGYVEPGQLEGVWDDGAPSVVERRDRLLLLLLDGADTA